MILIRNLNQINQQLPKTALTIGNFDGVHIAHQAIINKTQETARNNNLKSAIVTFEPHPIGFFNKNNNNFSQDFRINNLANKIKILQKLNPDYLIILPFNHDLSTISARDFIENILLKKFNAQSLIIGHDFTFGKNREGNIATLKKYNFTLQQIEALKVHNLENQELVVSSSLIRNYIKKGDVESIMPILGRNFAVDGIVVKGRQLAGTLGFKTANIKTKDHIIKPQFGVYKTRTFIKKYHKFFPSITNFGIKPTLDNKNLTPIFETHILNFSEDLYHQKITVEFLQFIRPEKKFSSLEELKNQISLDIKK